MLQVGASTKLFDVWNREDVPEGIPHDRLHVRAQFPFTQSSDTNEIFIAPFYAFLGEKDTGMPLTACIAKSQLAKLDHGRFELATETDLSACRAPILHLLLLPRLKHCAAFSPFLF
jgi:hypothetical protein